MAIYCPFCMRETSRPSCSYCGGDVDFQGKAQQLPVGTVLQGRQIYLVGASLGQGGFGVTYIALNINTMERVAIKEYFPIYWSKRGDDGVQVIKTAQEFDHGREKFFEEAKNIHILRHLKSVVNVREFFQANNTCYIVMEYLDGEDIRHLVRRTGRLSPDEVFRKFEPLMKDIDAMHNMSDGSMMLHRDIAPDNIMVLKDGSLRLMDFGSARSIQKDDNKMTKFIKPGYSPPEQYWKEGEQGKYTDVYSLAATMYFALTEEAPPDAMERLTRSTAENRDPLKTLKSCGVSVSANQENGIWKALVLNSKGRTQSIQKLYEEIYPNSKPDFWIEPPYKLAMLPLLPLLPRGNVIKVRWKDEYREKARFVLYRSVNGASMEEVASCEERSYTDKLPRNAQTVQYQLELQDDINGEVLSVCTGKQLSLPKGKSLELTEKNLLYILGALLVILFLLIVLLL